MFSTEFENFEKYFIFLTLYNYYKINKCIDNTNIIISIHFRELYLFGCGFQFAETFRVPFIPYIHSFSTHRRHVMDFVLDKTRSYPSQSNVGRDIVTDSWYLPTVDQWKYKFNLTKTNYLSSHSKYSITTVFTTGIVCKSHWYMDVFMFDFCISIINGIRRCQQLHGSGSNQSNERILRRRYSGRWRIQGIKLVLVKQ